MQTASVMRWVSIDSNFFTRASRPCIGIYTDDSHLKRSIVNALSGVVQATRFRMRPS